MQSVGDFLKEKRVSSRLSVFDLSQKTKIKEEFILSIEAQDWHKLPEFPVVLGFVKNISGHLDLDPNKIAALLRRDYPPTTININPKPDLKKTSFWTPKLALFVATIMMVLIVVGYLGIQYWRFVSPPLLEITSPVENQKVENQKVIVEGKTNPDAYLEANRQVILVNDDGSFSMELQLGENDDKVEIKAISRSDKETVIIRKINKN